MMKLSKLIRDYVDLKIEGEPKNREYSSIDANWQRRQDYRDSLEALEAEIDAAFEKAAQP